MAKKKKGGKKKGKKEAAPPPEVCTQHLLTMLSHAPIAQPRGLVTCKRLTHTPPACTYVQPPSEFDNMDIEALKEQIADYRNKVEVAQLDRNQVQLDRVWHMQPVLLLTGPLTSFLCWLPCRAPIYLPTSLIPSARTPSKPSMRSHKRSQRTTAWLSWPRTGRWRSWRTTIGWRFVCMCKRSSISSTSTRTRLDE